MAAPREECFWGPLRSHMTPAHAVSEGPGGAPEGMLRVLRRGIPPEIPEAQGEESLGSCGHHPGPQTCRSRGAPQAHIFHMRKLRLGMDTG